MKSRPPKFAIQLLEWFCKSELLEIIQGDLHELHQKRISKKGKLWADLKFITDVFTVCRPFAIKRSKSNSTNYAMLKNYYKVAIRNLFRHKIYSSIKIGGLSLGIAACLLITLFIRDELKYDTHYNDVNQIYRVINLWKEGGQVGKWPAQQAPMAKVMRSEIPELENVGRMIPYQNWGLAGSNLMRGAAQVQNTFEEGFAYADQEFLEILELPMVYGTIQGALTEPNTIVISQTKANKYFPNENPIGKVVVFNEDESNPYKITGVFEDHPATTHFDFSALVTLEGVEFWPGEQNNWCCSNYDTFVKLRKDASPSSVIEKLLSIKEKYIISYLKERNRSDIDAFDKARGYELQSIADVHLRSADIGDKYLHGDIKIVWMFAAIAFLILVLACINFINLSTAKAANRAKEVGLRKVVGSQKGNLIRQFLTESILFSFISFAVGVILARLFLPFFNEFADKALVFPIAEWWFVLTILASMLIIGLLAGLYPAFYLSKFSPIEVLKGKISLGSKGSFLQGSLVVFQFATSVVLIIGAFVVNQQMNFILNSNIGFEKDQVVLIHGTNTLGGKLDPLKTSLRSLQEVKNITTSGYIPVAGSKRDQNEFWEVGREDLDRAVSAQVWLVDDEYLETLGIELIEGRNLSNDLVSDTASIVVNEAFVKFMGYDEPLGKRIVNHEHPRTIVGVVKNFNFSTLEIGVNPLTFVLGSRPEITAVKVDTEDMLTTMNSIAKQWDKHVPNQVFRYEFLDERFALMYENVSRTGQIFTTFSIIAVIIACLGLFALSTFMVEQRRKEISIRKVLGASFTNLFQTLSSNFMKMILISLFIAIPIGWYIMNQWLQNYIFRTDLTADIFLLSSTIIVLVAISTISYEILRALRVNPAETLHAE